MFESIKAAQNLSGQKRELKKLIADCDELIKERGQSVSLVSQPEQLATIRSLTPVFELSSTRPYRHDTILMSTASLTP